MKTQLAIALFVLPLTAGACASTRPEARGDSANLIAMGPGARATSRSEAPLVQTKVSPEVLQDPAARFALTERLRTQIVARTQGEPDARYWNEVRPRLRREIESAGLPRADVDFLLWEVDQSRQASVQ